MANQQGWTSQTPAIQSLLAGAMRVGRAVRRGAKRVKKAARKAVRASGAKRSKRTSAKGKRPARFVKGSAAAKRYMASIRPKR